MWQDLRSLWFAIEFSSVFKKCNANCVVALCTHNKVTPV